MNEVAGKLGAAANDAMAEVTKAIEGLPPVITQDEADAAAEKAITESNADAEYDKLAKEIEADKP